MRSKHAAAFRAAIGNSDQDVAKRQIKRAAYSQEVLNGLPIDLICATRSMAPATPNSRPTHTSTRPRRNSTRARPALLQLHRRHCALRFQRRYLEGNQKAVELRLKDPTPKRLAQGLMIRSAFDVKQARTLFASSFSIRTAARLPRNPKRSTSPRNPHKSPTRISPARGPEPQSRQLQRQIPLLRNLKRNPSKKPSTKSKEPALIWIRRSPTQKLATSRPARISVPRG